jgi:hypothetical protein
MSETNRKEVTIDDLHNARDLAVRCYELQVSLLSLPRYEREADGTIPDPSQFIKNVETILQKLRQAYTELEGVLAGGVLECLDRMNRGLPWADELRQCGYTMAFDGICIFTSRRISWLTERLAQKGSIEDRATKLAWILESEDLPWDSGTAEDLLDKEYGNAVRMLLPRGRTIGAGDSAANKTAGQACLPTLSANAAAVYEILLALPDYRGLQGPKIVQRLKAERGISISEEGLRSRLIPELKPYGIENTPRIGYRISPDHRPPLK